MINKILSGNMLVLIKQHFKSQKEFAQHIEIRPETMNKIIKRGTLDLNTIDLIVNKYPNLNLNWLLYDKGEMWIKEEKSSPKSYPEPEAINQIVEESKMIEQKNNLPAVPIEAYLDHLKTEIEVLEQFIQSRSVIESKKATKKMIEMITAAGFKEVTETYLKKRSAHIRDFDRDNFRITLDGINCILMENGTGIFQKPLTPKNLQELIDYVQKNLQE